MPESTERKDTKAVGALFTCDHLVVANWNDYFQSQHALTRRKKEEEVQEQEQEQELKEQNVLKEQNAWQDLTLELIWSVCCPEYDAFAVSSFDFDTREKIHR